MYLVHNPINLILNRRRTLLNHKMALSHKHRFLHPFEIRVTGLDDWCRKPLLVPVFCTLCIGRKAQDFVDLVVGL